MHQCVERFFFKFTIVLYNRLRIEFIIYNYIKLFSSTTMFISIYSIVNVWIIVARLKMRNILKIQMRTLLIKVRM